MRRNKHNAQKVEKVVGGQLCRFDSLAEWRYAEWLERERRAKRLVRWEHHPKPLVVWDDVTGKELVRMHVDFCVQRKASATLPRDMEWHEVKGMATAVWRLKRRLLEVLTAHTYVVIDAGRGVCRTGEGEPALFDERPKRKRKQPVKSPRKSPGKSA